MKSLRDVKKEEVGTVIDWSWSSTEQELRLNRQKAHLMASFLSLITLPGWRRRDKTESNFLICHWLWIISGMRHKSFSRSWSTISNSSRCWRETAMNNTKISRNSYNGRTLTFWKTSRRVGVQCTRKYRKTTSWFGYLLLSFCLKLVSAWTNPSSNNAKMVVWWA